MQLVIRRAIYNLVIKIQELELMYLIIFIYDRRDNINNDNINNDVKYVRLNTLA